LTRLLVISDTHGNLANAQKAINLMGSIDLIVHAGDHYLDALKISRSAVIPVVGVAGNRDYSSEAAEEELFCVEDSKLYVTHGHQYAATARVSGLQKRAKHLGAQVVIYGHTHVPHLEVLDGRMYLNPGSLHLPRDASGKSFALLEIRGKTVSARITRLADLAEIRRETLQNTKPVAMI